MAAEARIRRIKAATGRGKELAIPYWVLDSGRPGPCLLITAAQHGNEVQGVEAIRRFIGNARDRLRSGKLIAVPYVNLPAVRERRPHILMGPEQQYGDNRGHNMNRTWPGKKSGNATAQLSHAVYSAVGKKATHVLDIHCWQKFHTPAVLIRDTPELRDLATRIGHPFVYVRSGVDHTIGGYFCSTDRVGVTYECAGQYVVDETQVQMCLNVISNMAKAIGVLAGRLVPPGGPVLFSDEVEAADVEAPNSGLFVQAGQRVCDHVRRGEVLGHILSDRDLKTTQIAAPAAGYLRVYGASRANCDVAMPGHHPYVDKGDVLATIVH